MLQLAIAGAQALRDRVHAEADELSAAAHRRWEELVAAAEHDVEDIIARAAWNEADDRDEGPLGLAHGLQDQALGGSLDGLFDHGADPANVDLVIQHIRFQRREFLRQQRMSRGRGRRVGARSER
jgi:hypothetical protein